jgi:hypothetical protein
LIMIFRSIFPEKSSTVMAWYNLLISLVVRPILRMAFLNSIKLVFVYPLKSSIMLEIPRDLKIFLSLSKVRLNTTARLTFGASESLL